MIKILFVPLLLLLMPGNTLAQEIAGQVSYKKELRLTNEPFEDLKETDPERYERFSSFTQQIVEAQKQVDYTLTFRAGTSNYYAEDILGKEKGLVNKIQSITGLFYTNVQNNDRFQELEVGGRSFIIQSKPTDWKITGETKMISGYMCRKAVATKTLTSSRPGKKLVRELVAWFAPEIPIPFGPEGYGGLPGLILEMTNNRDHYFATKIDIGKKDVEIRKPSKGDLVSQEEYQAIMAGLGGKFKSFHGIE